MNKPINTLAIDPGSQQRRRIRCRVTLNTPAFLGNYEQAGQWRTPPLKALLRHWWRIGQARHYGFDHVQLRQEEGRLFGHAWLEDRGRSRWASRSQVRLRLKHWQTGGLDEWAKGVTFKQVQTTVDGKGRVSADLYAGFGAILPPSRKEGRNAIAFREPAIDRGHSNELLIDFPEWAGRSIEDTLRLIHWFGAVGSRSRNGWGSLALISEDFQVSPYPSVQELDPWCRDLEQGLRECWPHSIGRDQSGPLVWYSTESLPWTEAINEVARLKVGVRRVAKQFGRAGDAGGIHFLGYPAGGDWALKAWDASARMASPLRFKIGADDTGCWITICHTPYGLPKPMLEAQQLSAAQKRFFLEQAPEVWAAIHRYLDGEASTTDHSLQRAAE